MTVVRLPRRLWRIFWEREVPIRKRHSERLQQAWLTGSWRALAEADHARAVELNALAVEIVREFGDKPLPSERMEQQGLELEETG